MKNRHIYMDDKTHVALKVYAVKHNIPLGKAIEKLLEIAKEKEC